MYGEGHYITFDEKTFNFRGGCSYIFAQVWHKYVLGFMISN